jgi:outer membrane protein OmpA-like peptidoglycan-associated protein
MRSIFAYIILLFIPFTLLSGQETFDEESIFYSADFEFNNGNFKKAVTYYEALLEKGIKTAHIKYKLARTYLEIPGKSSSAITLLEDAEKSVTTDFKTQNYLETEAPYEVLLLLGEAYQMNNLLDKATAKYKKYKSHIIATGKDPETINRKLNSISTALKLINTPLDVDKTFLPFNKTGISIYNPVFSGNNEKMAFISDRKYYKAIYFSEKQNENWLEPRNITMELESDGFFLITSLSYDGDVLYLTRKLNNIDYDLYYSRFTEGKWSKINSLDQINTLSDEIHACESPDGHFLIISSNRGSSIGEYDLYISSLTDENWDSPQNLGPVINTPYNESTPFYSPDGDMLYFSSEGHNNMGRYDIFRSSIKNNKFSTPQNLGYPVNTTKNDIFYCPTKNKFIGYTAGIFDKTNDLNIIKIEQFNASNPRKAIIEGTITTDIPAEKKQEIFEINCILFQFDDYGLSKTSTRQLDLVFKLLTRVSSANLVIIGHTDAIGSNKYNISLSQKRALSVQSYLIKKGITSKRLDVKWEGEIHPVAKNTNPDGTDNSFGRKFNRRVCFNFLNIPENVSVEYINKIPEDLKISY